MPAKILSNCDEHWAAPPTTPKSPTTYHFTERVAQAQSSLQFECLEEKPSKSLLLGLYRDESEQLYAASMARDPRMLGHLQQCLKARLSERDLAYKLRPDMIEPIEKLVLRDPHYSNDVSSSIAAHPELADILTNLYIASKGITSIRLEDVSLLEFLEFYPQVAAPLSTLLTGQALRSLTLQNCSVPWELFGSLAALDSLHVQGIEVAGYAPTSPAAQAHYLTTLRFQNSTRLIASLLESRVLGLSMIRNLGIDCGSESSKRLSETLVLENVNTLEKLAVRFEANSDDDANGVKGPLDFSTTYFRLLHTIDIGECYDISSLEPLSSALKTVQSIGPQSPLPQLTHLRLTLNGLPLPSTPSPHDFDLSTRSFLFQNILKRTLSAFDSHIAQLPAPIELSLRIGWDTHVLSDGHRFQEARAALFETCKANANMHIDPHTGLATFWSPEQGLLGPLEHPLGGWDESDEGWDQLGTEASLREYLGNGDSECLKPDGRQAEEVARGVLKAWFPKAVAAGYREPGAVVRDVVVADAHEGYPGLP